MNKCLKCGKEVIQIEGKKPRLFCNDACRMKYNRSNPNISNPNTIEIKSEQSKIKPPKNAIRELTPNEKAGITEYGRCHNCKEKVSHLICICRNCTSKGITHKSLGIDINGCESSEE